MGLVTRCFSVEVLFLLGSPSFLTIDQQLGTFHTSFFLKNRVARGCRRVTAIPRCYRLLQTVPRNTAFPVSFAVDIDAGSIAFIAFVAAIVIASLVEPPVAR